MKKLQSVNMGNHKNQHRIVDNRIFIDIYSIKEYGKHLKFYKSVTLVNHYLGQETLSIIIYPGSDVNYSCDSIKNVIKKICYIPKPFEEPKVSIVKSDGTFKPLILPKPATLNHKQAQIKQSKFKFYDYEIECNKEFTLPFNVDKVKLDSIYKLITTISNDDQIDLNLLRTYYKNIKAYDILLTSKIREQNHDISSALPNIRNLKFMQIMFVCNEFKADDKNLFCFFEELPNDITTIIGEFYYKDITN